MFVDEEKLEQETGEQGITLGEDGELNIPDDFWGEGEAAPETPEPEPAQEATAEPAKPEGDEPGEQTFYTPEEVAEAFAAGNVDPEKLRPELRDYYKAIDGRMRQSADAQRVQQELARQQQQPAQPSAPVSWEQLMEASKVLAARNYLGIKPEEFDEFDPRHAAARNIAMQEIRDRAQAMYQQQAYQQRCYAEVANVYSSYLQSVPEFNEIAERFFPMWRENLTVRDHRAVDEILASGDPEKLRKLFDRIVTDYQAGKEKTAPKPAPLAPPPVMGTAGSTAETGGVVDAAEFGNMTPEEQAEFLINNKFIG